MNRWIAFPRRVMALGLFMSLLLFLVAGLQQTRALTVLESGHVGACFCRQVSQGPYYWAFGLIEDIRDDDGERVIGRELIVFRALGREAPKPGARIRLDFDVRDFQRTTSGLAFCARLQEVELSDHWLPYRCYGIEDATNVLFIGKGSDVALGGMPFERLCTQPRDIHKIMGFLEEIDFDDNRCYHEIAEALDLVDPFQRAPEPEGCNGGNPLGLLWPTAGLVLLTRRRRTPPPD